VAFPVIRVLPVHFTLPAWTADRSTAEHQRLALTNRGDRRRSFTGKGGSNALSSRTATVDPKATQQNGGQQ
jgi:hypothetical protein